MYLIWETKKAW